MPSLTPWEQGVVESTTIPIAVLARISVGRMSRDKPYPDLSAFSNAFRLL